MNDEKDETQQGVAPQGDGTDTATHGDDTGATDTSADTAEASEDDGTGDDTNEGEEPPSVEEPGVEPEPESVEGEQVETAAEVDDEDDGIIILVQEDKTEIRYTLQGEASIGGADYRALIPVEGGDIVYLLYAKGDEADTYTDLDDDELTDVKAAFAEIFAAQASESGGDVNVGAGDDPRDVTVSDVVVEPGQGEAAQQG